MLNNGQKVKKQIDKEIKKVGWFVLLEKITDGYNDGYYLPGEYEGEKHQKIRLLFLLVPCAYGAVLAGSLILVKHLC